MAERGVGSTPVVDQAFELTVAVGECADRKGKKPPRSTTSVLCSPRRRERHLSILFLGSRAPRGAAEPDREIPDVPQGRGLDGPAHPFERRLQAAADPHRGQQYGRSS